MVPQLFRAWLKFESENISRPKSETAYLNMTKMLYFFFRLSEFFFYPLLARLDIGAGAEQPFGCPIVQNRQAVQPVGVDGLDSGGRHGRRFVLLHTHRAHRRPCPICTGRSGNVRHRYGGGWAGLRLFLGGSFRGVPVSGMKMRILVGQSVHSAFHW